MIRNVYYFYSLSVSQRSEKALIVKKERNISCRKTQNCSQSICRNLDADASKYLRGEEEMYTDMFFTRTKAV